MDGCALLTFARWIGEEGNRKTTHACRIDQLFGSRYLRDNSLGRSMRKPHAQG